MNTIDPTELMGVVSTADHSTREAVVPLGLKTLYCVFDHASKTCGAPVMRDNDLVARREFAALCADSETQYHKFPHDFTLRRVGTFDIQSCRLTPHDPEDIAFATTYVGRNND